MRVAAHRPSAARVGLFRIVREPYCIYKVNRSLPYTHPSDLAFRSHKSGVPVSSSPVTLAVSMVHSFSTLSNSTSGTSTETPASTWKATPPANYGGTAKYPPHPHTYPLPPLPPIPPHPFSRAFVLTRCGSGDTTAETTTSAPGHLKATPASTAPSSRPRRARGFIPCRTRRPNGMCHGGIIRRRTWRRVRSRGRGSRSMLIWGLMR